MKIELLGGTSREEVESRIKTVAAAGKLSRFPGNVFEVLDSCDYYESNLKMIKRIIKMGHKSIIEHDYLVFAICDVTPIIEQTIIGNRLTSFTIKSRREVDFRNVGYYIPEFRNENEEIHKDAEELTNTYKDHMKYLFNTYADLVDGGIPVEDSRFLLPYSYYSNIFMGLDARQLEKLIIYLLYGKVSKIAECKELGNKLLDIARQAIPYLVDGIENYNKKPQSSYLENTVERPKIKIIEKPELVSYTEDADNVIIESNIMYNYQCTKDEAKNIIKNEQIEDKNFKQNLIEEILLQEEKRELEQVSFTYQIPISLAILTHLTRHRMHSLLVPDFLPMWDLNNYKMPESIKNKFKDKFEEAFNKNIEVYNLFIKRGVSREALIYFYLGGNMCNVVTTMNARTLWWITRLRACNKAQWEIRNIAKEIVKQTKEVAPLLGQGLGPTCETEFACYEGKECCGKIEAILKNLERK